jgi:hypothetical protein
VRVAAEQTAARIQAKIADSLSQLDAAQVEAETKFREGLAEQARTSVAAARKELDAEATTLAESWKAARFAQEEEGRRDLARLGETAIAEYQQRLENASNSWLVAAVADLKQQSDDLIGRLANEAEERVRAACLSAFTEIGDALRQRLLGPSAGQKPPVKP